MEDCKLIVISKKRETEIDKKNIIINFNDLDKIRRGIDRISDLYNNESTISKEIFVFNELLHNNNPEIFQKRKKTTHGDIIYKIIKDTDFSKSISKSGKTSLLKIKNEAEVNYFLTLKNEFDKIITGDHSESVYQKIL